MTPVEEHFWAEVRFWTWAYTKALGGALGVVFLLLMLLAWLDGGT